MILDDNHIEQFERHAKGLMDEQEQDQFEELLLNNEEIRKEYYIFSDIFDDLNIIAESELKQALNEIHDNFSTDYLTKESKIRKLYYGLGIVFFALILYAIYMFGLHHPEMLHQKNENHLSIDSSETIRESHIEKKSSTKDLTAPKVIQKKTVINTIITSTQEISIIEDYVPTQSYSFSTKGLILYGINKKDVNSINIIKDKDLFFLSLNGAYYPIVISNKKTAILEKIKSPLKTITHGKKGREIPIQYIATLEKGTEQVATIIFDKSLKEDDIQFKSELIYLSEKHLPLSSLKKSANESIQFQSKMGNYIFDQKTSPKLQIKKDTKKSPEYVVLLERNWENDYLEENIH